MKKFFVYSLLILAVMIDSCKNVTYDWENFTTAATPKVTVNIEKSALPTVQTGKVSFFNMKDPEFATKQQFEWTLDYNDFDRTTVQSIEVYLSYNRRESSPPAYPIVFSLAGVYPSIRQFPLPSTVLATDKLFETVTTFPKTFTHTPAELAAFTGTNLSQVSVNDYFLFKFILTMGDGRRIVQYQENGCDESRGEPCDCRVGVRFKNQ
ncbi:hypothetical protein DSL64_03200 [Dyadobacter luteus]|jgi:hypothetical protein|uniref:Uncharacterized protein n=1 Tax=Dyadobacter luteus TaxID=2259619 RepID=A0A3D8YFM5_9BACT|nr:hypothetical protein [Dyadobacter luteus]REA63467.1 hypothetical protein DSL64_03200 [Dyadobacter luteus]